MRGLVMLEALRSSRHHEADRSALLERILEIAMELTAADFGDLQLFDTQKQSLRLLTQQGFSPEFLDYFREVSEGTACSQAMATRQRVIVKDVRTAALYSDGARLAMLTAGSRSLQSTPLLGPGGEVLGVFSTHHRRARVPSREELRNLDRLAEVAVDLLTA